MSAVGIALPPQVTECIHCDTALKPELLALDGYAPYRVFVYLCHCCSKTFRVEEWPIGTPRPDQAKRN